jgi:hypothetical protein
MVDARKGDAMARTKPMVEEAPEPGNRKTQGRGDRVELCMTVSHGLDVRLTFQAKLQRMARNQFTEKLLDQALSRYGTDKSVRAMFDDSELETDAAA